MTLWTELGIEPTQDVSAIRRAYAVRLKQVKPEADPAGFQRLRSAYDHALQQASGGQQSGNQGIAGPAPSETRPDPIDQTPRPPEQPVFGFAGSLLTELLAVRPDAREALLTERLRQPGWDLLDARARLQRILARALLSNFEHFFPLIDLIARRSGWLDNEDVISADAVVRELMARHSARVWRLEIESGSEPERCAKRMRGAMALLRQDVDVAAFEKFLKSKQNRKDMHALLKEMHEDYPAALHFETNPTSVRWWVARMESIQRAQATPKPAPKPTSAWTVLAIFVVIGAGSRILTAERDANQTYERKKPSVVERTTPPPLKSTPYIPHQQLPLTPDTSAVEVAPERNRGYWSPTTSYKLGDFVDFNGHQWVAVMASQARTPGQSDLWVRHERPKAGSSKGTDSKRTLEEIQRGFDQASGSFRSMYLQALSVDPAIQGKVVLSLTIEPTGKVSGTEIVSSELNNKAFEDNIIARVRLLRFAPNNGPAFTYPNYPIVFNPPSEKR